MVLFAGLLGYKENVVDKSLTTVYPVGLTVSEILQTDSTWTRRLYWTMSCMLGHTPVCTHAWRHTALSD